ncbi:transposase [Streptomyces sp. NPDC003832]
MSDELCSPIESLLLEPPPKQVEGRPRVPDRQALYQILFVLHTGIQWECLPRNVGFGSDGTRWRRLNSTRPRGRTGSAARSTLCASGRCNNAHARRRSTGTGRLEAPSDHR